MIVIGSFLFIQCRENNNTINLRTALKSIRRIFVGEWARNTPTMVGQGGADPPTPLGKGFTDPRSCRFPTDPYFIKRSIAEVSCPCLALFKGSPKTWRCLTGY